MRWLPSILLLALLAGAQQPTALFHDACMDAGALASLGVAPVSTYLQQVSDLQNPRQVAGALATLHRYGLRAGFALGRQPDGPGPLALRTGATHAFTQRLFELVGDPPLEAQREANQAINLAVALAVTPPAPRTHLSLEQLRQQVPNFDWVVYFNTLGVPAPGALTVAPQALVALRGQLLIASMASWKSYLRWRWLAQTAALLSPPFVAWHFASLGQQPPPRGQMCARVEAEFPADGYGAVAITREDYFGDVLRLRAWQVSRQRPWAEAPEAGAVPVLEFNFVREGPVAQLAEQVTLNH